MHQPVRSSTRSIAVAAVVCAATAAAVTQAATSVRAASLPANVAARASGCATAQLVVWLNSQGDGTAGSTYYKLEFTNLSARACTLRGYPGVSAVDLAGRRLGSAASRNNAHLARRVTLRRGTTASALLQVVDGHNFPRAACRPTTAAGLRVYPPNQTTSKLVPFPFLACGRTGPGYLRVEAVQ